MAFDFKKGDHRIEGFFDYVVPPLEGFWWQDGVKWIDYARKDMLCRLSQNVQLKFRV